MDRFSTPLELTKFKIMKKIFSVFSGGVWPLIILLAMIGGLIWFGVEFKSRGDELKAEKVLTDSLTKKTQNIEKRIVALNAKVMEDSSNYAKIIMDTQKSCLGVMADRDYWKDYAEKIESGKWCPEIYGWLKKKKRLVPCKPPPLPQ